MIRGAPELVKFILQNYTGLVIEVGAGFILEVASMLSPQLAVVATDKSERRIGEDFVVKDDIFSPKRHIYQGAVLLYSLRPPLEVQLAMGRLAAELRADVLIRPFKDEIAELPGFSRKLINIGQARFYLFKLKP